MTLPRPIKETLGRRIDEAGLAAVWRRVRERRHGRGRARGVGLALAGVSLALAVLFLWLGRPRWWPGDVEPLRLADRGPVGILEAPRGLRSVQMSDGSEIVLARGTRLDAVDNHDRVFGTTLVRGEAEFEVRPGGRRRWLVHAGHVTVEVVGTHFFVTREPGSVSVRVTRGEVMVRGAAVDGGARRLGVGESLRVEETSAEPLPKGPPPAEPLPAEPLPSGASLLPPPYQIGAQRLSGADPHLPDDVRQRLRGKPDGSFVARICVDRLGAVSDVAVLQGIAGADESLLATLRQWRYEPQPIPFCFVTQLVFSVE